MQASLFALQLRTILDHYRPPSTGSGRNGLVLSGSISSIINSSRTLHTRARTVLDLNANRVL